MGTMCKRTALYIRKHMLFPVFSSFFPVACRNLKSKNSIVLLSVQISISKPDSDVRGVKGGGGISFQCLFLPFHLTQSSFLKIQYPVKQPIKFAGLLVCWKNTRNVQFFLTFLIVCWSLQKECISSTCSCSSFLGCWRVQRQCNKFYLFLF